MELKLSYDDIKKVVLAKGFKWVDDEKSVFLYGIRSRSLIVDLWNDVLGVCYIDDFGNKVNIMHKASTKPGLNWLKDKTMNVHGTSILQPGQFKDCWILGQHKGSGVIPPYLALVQVGPGVFKCWRDGNKDGRFDFQGSTYVDVTGLNMHTESMSHDSEKVGDYSAGCQVRAYDKEHFMVMNLLQKEYNRKLGEKIKNPDVFSYTLLEERDFMPS